jgi:hypothetical protein
MENDKSIITTTDIINKVDNNGNIILTKIRKTYNGSTIVKEEYLNNEDKSHRDGDLPAYIKYFTTGNVYVKQWHQNDCVHRDEDKPAIILYDKEGNIMSEEWYQNNKAHRVIEKGPAYIEYNKNKTIKEEKYYLDGKLVEKSSNVIDEISKFSNEDILKCLEILKIIKK